MPVAITATSIVLSVQVRKLVREVSMYASGYTRIRHPALFCLTAFSG